MVKRTPRRQKYDGAGLRILAAKHRVNDTTSFVAGGQFEATLFGMPEALNPDLIRWLKASWRRVEGIHTVERNAGLVLPSSDSQPRAGVIP